MSSVDLGGSHAAAMRGVNERNGTPGNTLAEELLYAERYAIERINAWVDSYRTILNQFETTAMDWGSWNYIAFMVIPPRKCLRKRKV